MKHTLMYQESRSIQATSTCPPNSTFNPVRMYAACMARGEIEGRSLRAGNCLGLLSRLKRQALLCRLRVLLAIKPGLLQPIIGIIGLEVFSFAQPSFLLRGSARELPPQGAKPASNHCPKPTVWHHSCRCANARRSPIMLETAGGETGGGESEEDPDAVLGPALASWFCYCPASCMQVAHCPAPLSWVRGRSCLPANPARQTKCPQTMWKFLPAPAGFYWKLHFGRIEHQGAEDHKCSQL